ncbi:hypothetical protein Vretimale_2345 [Volvox reticuliferus]|nr:hypothetical protein Vretimale_2345 [Volvox reticuliferus]
MPMAEILSGRGRAQSRGEYVGANNGGGASTGQSSLSAAGGTLRRPSRLLLSSVPSSGPGQDHAVHTLPPLSPGNNAAIHATHRVISGTNGSRGLANGGLGSAAGRPDGSTGGAGSNKASSGTQARGRILPGTGTGGTGSGAGSGSSGGVGAVGGSSLIGTERRRAQAVMADQTRGSAVTAGAGGVARTAAAGGGVAGTTKGRATGRPSMRLARDSTQVSGPARQQGGRGTGPVAGPGSAAARAAEARAAAAAAATAVPNSGDDNGDGDDGDDFGRYSYTDVGRSSGGGSEPSGAGECSAGPGRAPSQTHQMLQSQHSGIGSCSTAAATASGVLSSVGGSPSTSTQLGLRATMSHMLSLHRPSSPLTAPGPRSPGASASVATTASGGTLSNAVMRPLSSRTDDASTPSRHQQPQPPPLASDPLGLGIGPLSMFGPLAAAPPHTTPHSSALPRPSSSASSPPVNAAATAAGSTNGFMPGSVSGFGSGHGLDPDGRALLRPSFTPAAPGTGAGMLERDSLGSHVVDAATPDSANQPSSGSSEHAIRQLSSRGARGTALRGTSHESSSTAAARSVAASQRPASSASAQATAATGAGPRMQVAMTRAAARAAGRTTAPSAAASATASGTLSAATSNIQNGVAAQSSGVPRTSAAAVQLASGNRSRRGLSTAAGTAVATTATTSPATSRTTLYHRAPTGREDVQSETASSGITRRNNAEAAGDSAAASITAGAAVSASGAGVFSLFSPLDSSPPGHAVVGTGGNGGSAAAVARAAARRRSSNGPSEGGNSGGAGGLRGAIRQRGTGLDADAIPLGGVLGGRVGVGSRVVAASRAAAGATRLLYDSGNAFSSDDDSYGDGDSNGSSEPGGAIRHSHVRMPQRLFRVHLNPQAAEATTFGPTRPMGPSRPPLPHAHQHQTPAQVQQHNRLHHRSSSGDGVVGGALAIGSGSGGFQERFLADLRRRDAQRAALMQLLMIGGEEELLRQAEEEQLALGESKGLCPIKGAGYVR